MANRNVRGPKKQYGHSCGKLKKRKTPQGISRVGTGHPQSLERLTNKQEAEEQAE